MNRQSSHDRSDKRKLTLVTGASEGIGRECAMVFARAGHDLALVARRRDRLEAVAQQMTAEGLKAPLVLAYDLGRPDAVAELAEELEKHNSCVTCLVNNAGYGLIGTVESLDAAEQLAMIDLNIRALTALTLRFLPQIKADKGGILNIASVASFAPGPGMSIYYATKAYVLSFTEGLAQELHGTGVRVSALCPGPVHTGFQARAGIHAGGTRKIPGELSALQTAQAGYDGMIAGKIVILPGLTNKLLAAGLSWIPHAILLPGIFARQTARK